MMREHQDSAWCSRAPLLNPDPNGSGLMFPGPSTVPASYDKSIPCRSNEHDLNLYRSS